MSHHEIYKGLKIVLMDRDRVYAYIVVNRSVPYTYLSKHGTVEESRGSHNADELNNVIYSGIDEAKESIDRAMDATPEQFI